MNEKTQILNDFYPDNNLLIADGFDDAIIGVSDDIVSGYPRVVYSKLKRIEILIKRDKMSKDEAEEYFNFNVQGAYMGKNTPIWVDDLLFNY